MHGLWEENCLTSFGCTVFCVWVTAAAVLKGVESNWDKILDLRYLFFFLFSFLQLSLKDLRSPSGERRSCWYRACWQFFNGVSFILEEREDWELCVFFFSQLSVCLGLGEICFLSNVSYFFYIQPPKLAFLFRFTPWLPRNHTPAWICCLVFQFCLNNIAVLLKVTGHLRLSWNQSFNSQPINGEIPRHVLQHQGVHTLAIMKSRLL